MDKMKFKLLIHSAKQIVAVTSNKQSCIRGTDMKDGKINVVDSDSDLAILISRDGTIEKVGTNAELLRYADECITVYDASGMSVLPGLVDGHTHTVWAGDRVHEFAMKLAGAAYMEIHAAGGGIGFTVGKTREASEDELYQIFTQRLNQLLKSGVTLAEVKSGYGLDYDTELKMLNVINQAVKDPSVPMDISITYCGAHSVPKDSTAEQATRQIIDSHIPRLRELCNQVKLKIDNIDVFCETGVFNVDQTKQILCAGKAAGWAINFHGEELSCLNSVEMGVDIGATAISHLEEISDEGIKVMSNSDTVAVILPTTAHLLHLKPPPVKRMIEAGCVVALGTDFNPNAYCLSMPHVMNLACVTLGMTMPQALAAATINAAASINKSHSHGSIEIGKVADFIILDAPRWEHLIYQMGTSEPLIKTVFKHGTAVYNRPE